MVDFEANAGYSVTGNRVHVDFSEQTNRVVMDALTEAHTVAADRKLLSEGVASVALEASIAGVSVQDQPELLVATVDESGAWYTKVANELNDGRKKKDKVQVVPEDELPGRAEAWTNEARLKAAEEGLDYDEENPLLLLAVPNTLVSHKEIVQTWANARGGRLWSWGGRLAFLQQWSADQLSGFDVTSTSDPVRFVAIETGYDEDRSGNRQQQLDTLRAIQGRLPQVRSASLFEGGILANRYSDEANPNWRETYVRQIELKPDSVEDVPGAVVDVVGLALVDGSHVGFGIVSRRLVG